MTYYKFLNDDGTTPQQRAQWKLPKVAGKPGAWMPAIKGDLVECENAYHIMRERDLVHWLGPVLWEVEPRGPVSEWGNKCGARSARLLRVVTNWNERTARLFACDCAERALELAGNNPDQRSIEAVRVARLFAVGEATKEDLSAARDAAMAATMDAASDSAMDAAWAAAGDAAVAAARTATMDAAMDAARTAARTATMDAAMDAAMAAAMAAAREWQAARLMEYFK